MQYLQALFYSLGRFFLCFSPFSFLPFVNVLMSSMSPARRSTLLATVLQFATSECTVFCLQHLRILCLLKIEIFVVAVEMQLCCKVIEMV